jgi:hypothetical protein
MWMPEHPHHCRAQAPPPLPMVQGCQHKQPQWFTRYFDPNTAESKAYYVGRKDVGDDMWSNRLQSTVASAQTCFELPYDNALFYTMMDRPDLFFQWHNPKSGGAFYLSIGCANCSRRTGHYQPQYQVHAVDNPNPEHYKGKALKELECVKSSYRVFLAAVLDEPELAVGEKCRHLHQDTPPLALALENLQ